MSLTRIGSIGINTGIAFAGVTTIVTLNTANDALSIGATVNVGSGITLGASGDIFATGIITATSFVGSGSGLTGVASTDNIRTNTNATFLQNINVSGSTTTGSLVSSGAISGTTGTFTGDVDIADKIIHTGDTNTALRFPAADTVTVETGGSERIRVDSAGRLGVGQNSPTALLHLKSNAPYITFEDDDNNQDWQIQATAWFAIRDQTNSAERLRIDSSGRVLIGTTTEGVSTADDLTVANSGHGGITIRTGTSSLGNLYFSDGTSGDDEYRGVVQYDHSGDFMRFLTNASERLRITSDGAIGLSGTNYGSSGQVLTSGGSGSAVSWTTVSGTTINNNADNRLITGSGTANTLEGEDKLTWNGNNLHVERTVTAYKQPLINIYNSGAYGWGGAIRFSANWANTEEHQATIRTYGGSSSTGASLAFEVGASNSEKLRILPTGGITFNGDTATANALDDYEEGDATITVYNNSNVSINSTYNKLDYTKIGNLVNITMLIIISGVHSGDYFRVNLPFTSVNHGNPRRTDAIGVVMHNNVNTGDCGLVAYLPMGSSILHFYKVSDNSSWSILTNSDLASSDEMYVTITYKTA